MSVGDEPEGSEIMNTRQIAIGRIVFALAAFALLAGFTVRSAGAMDGQTITSRAADDTAFCLSMGESPGRLARASTALCPAAAATAGCVRKRTSSTRAATS